MIPVARTEKLLIQEVGGELIVYDQETNASHCLNRMAARVWELCDGRNTVNDLANLLEEELEASDDSDVDMRGLIWLTLEELERYNLIKEYRKEPIAVSNISRRKVIKTATLVGGFALGSMFPLVRSIIAPAPVSAKSKVIAGITFCKCSQSYFDKRINKSRTLTINCPVGTFNGRKFDGTCFLRFPKDPGDPVSISCNSTKV